MSHTSPRDPWKMAAEFIPGSSEIPRMEYVKTGSTVAPGDAVLGEDGRAYHGYKEGAYLLPNDGEEQDRLDLQHNVLKLALGSLALAPISKQFTGTCLDISTGTGIWALEFAQQNPGARVIGADLSKIQPDAEMLQATNCEFIKQDVEETDWILGTDHRPVMFDYVHSRLVMAFFDSHLKYMKPGAWIEFQEGVPDITSPDGSREETALQKVYALLAQGAALSERDLFVGTRFKQLLAEAGFVDITVKQCLIPTGVWPSHNDPEAKKLAGCSAENIAQTLGSAGGKLLRAAGMDQEALEKLPWMLRQELQNPRLRFQCPFFSVCGRKPYEGQVQSNKS